MTFALQCKVTEVSQPPWTFWREIRYVVILLLEHSRKIISVEMSIFRKFKLPKLSGVNGKSDSEVDINIPRFKCNDLPFKQRLGRGSFGDVYTTVYNSESVVIKKMIEMLEKKVLDWWVFVLDHWVFVLDHRVLGLRSSFLGLRFRHIHNGALSWWSTAPRYCIGLNWFTCKFCRGLNFFQVLYFLYKCWTVVTHVFYTCTMTA